VVDIEFWPEQDRLAWLELRKERGPFADVHRGSRWAPLTWKIKHDSVGRYIGFEMYVGGVDFSQALSQRVTADTFQRFMKHLRDQVSLNTVRRYAVDLQQVLQALDSKRDWTWMKRECLVPSEAEANAARKKKTTFHPPSLFHAAIRRMNEIDDSSLDVKSSVVYRNSLIASFLVCYPIRRANLAAMEIGRHLRILDGVMHLSFEANEVKVGKSIFTTLPEELRPYFQRYIEGARTVLLNGHRSNMLWISSRGLPLRDEGMHSSFASMGRDLLGFELTPHMFRRAGPTWLIGQDARNTRFAARTLGHANTKSVNGYYDLSDGKSAFQAWQKLLRRSPSAGELD